MLVLDGDVLEGAEEAFQELRYVEAFSLLQASIDAFMTFVYEHREGTNRGEDKDSPPEKHNFWTLRNYLHDNDLLSEKEDSKLTNFYELRNRMIHKLVMYAFQSYPRYSISKSEAIKGFERGKELYLMLDKKTHTVGNEVTRWR